MKSKIELAVEVGNPLPENVPEHLARLEAALMRALGLQHPYRKMAKRWGVGVGVARRIVEESLGIVITIEGE